MTGRRVVFLDRDGVLTVPDTRDGKGFAVRSLARLKLYPDAAISVERLRGGNFEVVVVTNQPDVANGLLDPLVLDAIHLRVTEELGVDGIRTCTHAAEDGCTCRKPKPGMLHAEGASSPIDYSQSWLVGDRDSDIKAGKAAGCRTVFINRGWRAETGTGADHTVFTLGQAVDTILHL